MYNYKRWEPIRAERKQLGGLIKLIKKISPKLVPKEMSILKGESIKLTPKQIEQEGREGLRDLMMWFKTPRWKSRAASRTLTPEEINAFQNLQGRILSQKLPMDNKYGPMKVIVENVEKDFGKGVEGYSQFLPINVHGGNYPSEHFLALSESSKHPYYTAVHEGLHQGTFNIGYPGWEQPKTQLSQIEQSALDKVLTNAKALADRLEVDPNKFNIMLKKVQKKYGMSELEARSWLKEKIKYWQNPQEARARAGAINLYKERHPNATEEELAQIDNARYVFTNESLDNLYGKIIALGTPIIGGGALASTQLGE